MLGANPPRKTSGLRAGARRALTTTVRRPARIALIVGAIAAGPLLGLLLLVAIGPTIRWLQGPDSRPFWLSLRVSLTAIAFAGTLGVAAGYALAKGRFAGRDALEAIGSLPIILPPTVLGYYLLQLLNGTGRGSATGRFLTGLFGHKLVYNVTGCVVVAAVAGFPLCMRAARAAFEAVDPGVEQAARAMGRPDWWVAARVSLPLARRGVVAGLTLGFVRGLGEYGATVMVGGDIPSSTRTMPIAITEAFTTHDRQVLIEIMLAIAAVALLASARLGRPARGHRA